MAEKQQHQTILYKLLVDKRYSIARHLILILALLLVTLNYCMFNEDLYVVDTPAFKYYCFFMFLSYLIPCYFNLYFLLPGYLLKKKYLVYFISLLFVVLLMLIGQYLIEHIYSEAAGLVAYPIYNSSNIYILLLDLTANFLMHYIAYAGLSVTLLLRHWMDFNERAGQLEREHMQTEVEQLKQQINPVFLFNTLHCIARTGETDTAQASRALLKFSKLLRYQIYDSSSNEVFLNSEIQYLNHYLELEQLHYQQLRFSITTLGDMSCVLVPPVLFIPFVRQLIDEIQDADAHANLCLTFCIGDENRSKLVFDCVGDTCAGVQSDQFSTMHRRLGLLFGTGYSLELLPPPFIIPDGHRIHLTLNLD